MLAAVSCDSSGPTATAACAKAQFATAGLIPPCAAAWGASACTCGLRQTEKAEKIVSKKRVCCDVSCSAFTVKHHKNNSQLTLLPKRSWTLAPRASVPCFPPKQSTTWFAVVRLQQEAGQETTTTAVGWAAPKVQLEEPGWVGKPQPRAWNCSAAQQQQPS